MFEGQAMTAGDIYIAAGNGRVGFSGDGGPATSAELSLPANAVSNRVIADAQISRSGWRQADAPF
jgi:hypothetical protein